MAPVTGEHFAIGLIVTVRDGAAPVGTDTPLDERPVRMPITAVFGQETVAPFGSFEVGGWWWDPRDIYHGLGD